MTTITKQLAQTGEKKGKIQVTISYRILELFSAGLYSSPNKAIEELVANSYDALARHVHVIMPTNIEAPDAVIWVIDDGESMDATGLANLWRIATSTKRDPGMESKDRPPIGKFGIGKLATYVLARQLTYVCKSGGKYRAVTMDFSGVNPKAVTAAALKLDLRELSKSEAETLLRPITERKDDASKALPLFGTKAATKWTVVAMANLTPLAQKLTLGRLRWVLATSLPLSPQFDLFFNGQRLRSPREEHKVLQTWTIGRGDALVDEMGLRGSTKPVGVHIDGVGFVRGTATIYEDPLTGGKADRIGRSHGVFVIVRERLINLDDALFGLPALSHGPFARFRIEIHADGLDSVLRSTRETVLETDGVKLLRTYINNKFNEARKWYDNWLTQKDHEGRMSTRIGSTPQSLSRRPLVSAIRGVLDGSIPDLLLTDVPKGLSEAEKTSLQAELETDLNSEIGLIREVRFETLGMERGLAVFDVKERCVRVNLLHPFYANYSEHYANPEPFELLAVAEVLTEAYLLEEGVPHEVVRSVMRRRDRFLRELVYSRQLSAPLVAEFLRDSASHPVGLEKAVAAGLTSLGFEVSPIGGKGEPDGVALARLGVRDDGTGARADYKITYDAKSTLHSRVQAHTVGSGGIARHREKYQATFSLVVAPGFAGEKVSDAAIVTEARAQGITLMTIPDFVKLVLAAATRQLGFSRLRTLFETCRAPEEAAAWVDGIIAEKYPEGPLADILEAIWELQAESPDPVKFAAVRMQHASLKGYRETELRDWMMGVRRLAGGFVTIDGDVVSLEAPPQKILSELRRASSKLPEAFLHRPADTVGKKTGKGAT
jgi:Histidine kinase-, DNA gyrase B-, and HSP90-like ATPase